MIVETGWKEERMESGTVVKEKKEEQECRDVDSEERQP